MKILVVPGNNYPSHFEPQKGIFVYKLVQEFCKHNTVYVFAPRKRFIKSFSKSRSYGTEGAKVYRPKFTSLSNIRLMGFNTYDIGRKSIIRHLERVIKVEDQIDAIYAHFLSNALIAVEALGKKNIPVFAAVGEYKNIDIVKAYYDERVYSRLISKIDGFIAVSPQVQEKLIGLGVDRNKILIAPNGTDLDMFKPRNQVELRRKYGMPLDKKIVLFVGRFLESKGPIRVLNALNKLNGEMVGIFIGNGPQELAGEKIIFQGPVLNYQVAEFMALSDVFVLPTLHEGSSNVIVEAMASGLPIISSDLPEIKVQCDSSFSILIDPMNIDQISDAINKILSDDDLKTEMSLRAREKSKDFDLKARAKLIEEFIQNKK